MNKTYRLIWNELSQAWVAVAEIAKARGKRAAGVVLLAASGVSLAASPAPNQLPTGGSIVGGKASGSISTSGGTMTVTQNVQRMIANWDTFNIGANASVRFVQPSSTAIALNRVLSQDPTQILGSLSANGQVMLVNPAGIVFGQGSQVNTGALVASTLAISDANFLTGNYSFARDASGSAGSVINQGRIVTADGGVVAFIAPIVKNEGRIETPKGSTLLAAADKVSVDFKGDGLITYSLDAGTANALVDNSGSISADGGVAVLSAKAADAVAQAVVNNTGVVRARTLDNRSGRILLLADMENGEMRVGGTLDASAPNGGDGGVIETSGHVLTMNNARIDAGAANGQGGTWLIDPQDLTINATGAGNIQTALNSGTSVTATTSACSTTYGACSGSTGNLTLASSIAKTAGGAASLTLIADGYLLVNSGVTISDASSANALSLNLQSTGPIRFADNTATTNSVNIHGALYMGGKAGGATYATGNNSYSEGIYIGNNSALTAGSMTLYGQGKAGAAGVAGGTGVKLGSAASLAATGAIGVTGIGGQGGSGVSAGSSGGKGGTGSQGGAGTAGDSGAAGGAGITADNTASIVADSVALTGSGGQGGAGRTGGQGGQGGDSEYAGPSDHGGTGGTGGAGGAGGSGGIGIGLGSVTVSATTGVNLSGTGGVGGVGGVGGSGGRGGYANWADYAGTGGTGGKGGAGGAAAIGVALANGISIASSAGAVSMTSASTAGAGGKGGVGGGGGDCHELATTCAGSNGNGADGAAGAAAVAFNAAGSGYIGAANGGSSSANISFINDSMSLGALAIQSSGALNIQTKTASTLIDLGTYTTDATHLQLGQGAFWNGTSGNFRDGLSAITVGSATQTGAIAVGTLAYSDALTLQTSGAMSVSGSVTTRNNSLTVSGARYTQSDVDIVAGSGNIVIAADAVALNTNTGSNALQTTGALTLKTKSAATAMSLAGSAAFDLSSTEIGYLKNSGASSITIGRSDSTGSLTIGSAVDLAGKNVTLAAGSLTDGGNSRVITADTLNLSANGAIGGSGTNYAIDVLATSVSANTTGNANAYLTSTAGYTLGASNVGSGTLSLTTTGTGGSIVQSGAVTAGTLTANLAGTSSRLDLDNNENAITTLAGITASGGFSLDNGNNATTLSGNLTTSGGNGAVSIDTGTGTYTQNANIDIASGSGAITLTADNMVINSNSGNNAFTTTGALTLQAATASRGVTLGGSSETAGQLTLQGSEFAAFSNTTASSVSIGRADSTGTMTLGGALGLAGKTLDLKAGSITDGATTDRVITAGTLKLLANGNIGGTGNSAIDFVASTVSANTSGNASAYLTSTGGYALAASDVGSGTLSLASSGNVTQSGALTAGTLALQVGGSLSFGQPANRIAALTGSVTSDLLLSDATALAVNATTVGGNLALTIDGDVSNGGTLSVAGSTTVDAGSHDVSLTRSGNSLAGAVSVTADDLELRNATATVLGALNLGGAFSLTSSGAVSQTAAASAAGTTSVSAAGQNVTLNNVGNNFTGAVGVTGANVAITSQGDLHLASSTASGTFIAVAGGTAGTGDLYLDSGTTITSGNDKTASGTANSVVLVAGDGSSRFINKAGENAIKLTYGSDPSRSRWLVYTNDPYHNADVLGDLKSYNEAIYGTYYTGHSAGSAGSVAAAPSALTQAGNRYVLKTLLTEIPDYDDHSVKVSVIGSSKTYGDTLALNTTDNSAIVYASGSMSFAEFSDPRPSWLNISGLSLSSVATDVKTHVGNYDITATGSLSVNGNDVSFGTLGAGGTNSWNYSDATYSLQFVDTAQITVTPRTLTLTAAGGTVADKVYDGTTTATFSSAPLLTLGNIVNSDAVSLAGTASGTFEDKNVGTAKTVTLSGLTLANNSDGDYVLPDTLPTYTGKITARSITVAATGVNKVYDATDNASATLAASSSATAGTAGSGYILGDKIAYSYTAAVFDAGKNAGAGKAVTVNGIALSGDDAGNYALTSTTAATVADIAKRSISLASLTGSKVYDGDTALSSATLTVDTSGVLGSDVITGASGSATFDTRHAGSGKALSTDLATLTLSGDDAANYTLGTGSYSGSGTITPKAVTLTAGSVSKSYDATTAYTAQAAELAALSSQLGVAGDTIGAATVSYADANAGTGKTVTLDTVSVADGNGGGNYAVTLIGNNSSSIDKAVITVSTGSVVKTYDGTTSANGSGVVVSGRLYGSDTLIDGSLTYAFADKNAGTDKTVSVGGSATVSDGNSGGNYTVLLSDNTTSTIDKAALTVTASSASKTYDGTTTAGGTATVGTLAGAAAGDTVAAAATQTFADKNAGTGKTVNAGGLTLKDSGNADVTGNYAITYVADTTGVIDKAALTVTASSVRKTYDGTTAAGGTATVGALAGAGAGDTVATAATQTFADKNAGTGKTVNAGGLTLKDSSDADVTGNYAITYVADTTGVITPRLLKVDYAAQDKIYDGNIIATVSTSDDRVSGDKLIISSSAAFEDPSVGTNKPVSITLGSLAGEDAGNYALASISGRISASISGPTSYIPPPEPTATPPDTTLTTNIRTDAVLSPPPLISYGPSSSSTNSTSGQPSANGAGTASPDGNAGGSGNALSGGSGNPDKQANDGEAGNAAGAVGLPTQQASNDASGSGSAVPSAVAVATAGATTTAGDDRSGGQNASNDGATRNGSSPSGTSATGQNQTSDSDSPAGTVASASDASTTARAPGNDADGKPSVASAGGTPGGSPSPAEQGSAGNSDSDIKSPSGNRGDSRDGGQSQAVASVDGDVTTQSRAPQSATGASGGPDTASPEAGNAAGAVGLPIQQASNDVSGSGSAVPSAVAVAAAGATTTAGDDRSGGQSASNDGTTRNGSSSSGTSATGQNRTSDLNSPAGASDTDANTAARARGNDADGKETMTSAGGTQGDGQSPAEQGSAGNSDSDIKSPSGNQGDSRDGGQSQAVASADGDVTTQSRAPQSSTSASGGPDAASAEASNAIGAHRNDETTTVKDGGQLVSGTDDGTQTAQFAASGNTTTLTFGAFSTSGGKGQADGPTGGAGDNAPSGSVIPLFSQRDGKATLGGALMVVEQGRSLQASSASVNTVSAPRLNPATMRYVSVDYRLPTGSHSPIAVGVSPEGVLVIGVSAAIKTTMDDRSIALLGISVARDRLDVKPASVTGVLIQVDGAAGSNSLLHVKATNPADLAVPGLGIDVGTGRVTVALLGKQVDGSQIAKGGASVAMTVATLGAKGEVTPQSSIVATDSAGAISVEDITGVPGTATAAPGTAESGIPFVAMSGRDGASLPFEVGVAGNALVIRAQSEASRDLMLSQRNVVIGVAIAQLSAKRGIAHDRIDTVYLTSGM